MKEYSAKELMSPEHSKLFDAIVSLLTYSFTEDVMHRWLFSDLSGKDYLTALTSYMRSILHLALLADASVVVVTGDESAPATTETNKNSTTEQQLTQLVMDSKMVRACSVTIPPHGNAAFDSNITAIRAGALTWPMQLGIRPTYKLVTQLVPELHKLRTQVFPDASVQYHNYHLLFLATHPDSQGQGLGKKLLLDLQNSVQKVNDAAAQNAEIAGKTVIPCPLYLESSSVNSKRLYERVGYELRATMVYGVLDEGEDLNLTKDGTVLGGKEFGMVWSPKLNHDMQRD